MSGYYESSSSGGQEPKPKRDTSSMSTQERFDYAKTYRIGFGQYRGLELNQIADHEDGQGRQLGLQYLGWLKTQDWLNEASSVALNVFTSHPQVSHDLEAALKAEKAGPRNQPGKY